MAGGGLVGGELAEAEEGEAGGQLLLLLGLGVAVLARGGQLDRGDLEEAKVRGALGAVAHDDELDLGQDEAVAAAVLAHDVVQVGEAAEVLDALDVALDAHARVEPVKRLGQADDAGRGLAAEHGGRRGRLALDVGSEDVLGVARLLGRRRRRELQRSLRGERERRVELGDVVGAVDLVQSSLGLRVARRGGRLREERGRDGAAQQARRAGERQDVGRVEVGPGADLAHIPPKVLGVGIPERVGDGADQRRGRVGRRQVAHQGGRGNGLGHGLRRRGDAHRRGIPWGVLGVHVRVVVSGLGHRRHVLRHLAVGREAVLLQRGAIQIAGGCATRAHVILREDDGRAHERLRVLSLVLSRCEKGSHELVQRLGVGVAPVVGRAVGRAGRPGLGSRRHRRPGALGGCLVDLLVLGTDLGQQDRAMLADRGRRPRWCCDASSADGV